MKVQIVQYDPSWENKFSQEKSDLLKILSFLNIEIEHIGSTSIKGLGAKPIIDIILGVDNYDKLDLLADKMVKSHFTYYRIYNNIMPERRLFSKMSHPNNIEQPEYLDEDQISPRNRGFIITVNCHCVVKNSPFWQRHIFFRDYLRNNDKVRNDYNNLKIQLSQKDWTQINDYTDAKTEFIKSIESKMI